MEKTKEEILDAEFLLNHDRARDKKSLRQVELTAMQTYADQQTTSLKAENERLRSALTECRDVLSMASLIDKTDTCDKAVKVAEIALNPTKD